MPAGTAGVVCVDGAAVTYTCAAGHTAKNRLLDAIRVRNAVERAGTMDGIPGDLLVAGVGAGENYRLGKGSFFSPHGWADVPRADIDGALAPLPDGRRESPGASPASGSHP
ncbi:hypothetical protein [Streptomyces sp. SID3343]|uniref:hypothetical protein n=1 Tax=Streptomyces sp. SID3343 TaxID=2690260 RepID=UPI00136B4868|nr:hypothetical protein [Streptomyces sp. SID3343]MYW02327.1 hypothetical protein [Streptomyces sp. SID3343]